MSSISYLLKDVQKYDKDFDASVLVGATEDTVKAYLRKFYKNLGKPIDTTTWIRVNEADPKYFYAESQGDQICFVRDKLRELIVKPWDGNNFKEYNKYMQENEPVVISTHMSKSVLLPVYELKSIELGVVFVLRCNFYDWKISVESEHSLDCDFMGLFDKDKVHSSVYCEGMEHTGRVYGSYNQNSKKFTVEFQNTYEVYTFIKIIANYLKGKLKEAEQGKSHSNSKSLKQELLDFVVDYLVSANSESAYASDGNKEESERLNNILTGKTDGNIDLVVENCLCDADNLEFTVIHNGEPVQTFVTSKSLVSKHIIDLIETNKF